MPSKSDLERQITQLQLENKSLQENVSLLEKLVPEGSNPSEMTVQLIDAEKTIMSLTSDLEERDVKILDLETRLDIAAASSRQDRRPEQQKIEISDSGTGVWVDGVRRKIVFRETAKEMNMAFRRRLFDEDALCFVVDLKG